MASTMRLPGALAAIFLFSLPACGDSTATTAATDATAGTTTTGTTTVTTTEAVTTSGTEAPTSSTTSTSTMTPETSTSTSTTTTGVSASTSETASTTETTSAVTTETTGETTGETDTGNTTGEPMGSTCVQDSDCKIFTDCCTCDVIANDEQPPECGVQQCFVDACATLDIGNAAPVCRFGRCTFEKVNCNPNTVLCDSLPPNCPVGQLPTVKNDCWSGQCAPVEACDWVPDCAACKTDISDPLVCVFKAQKGAYHVCEPKPVACGDVPEIDCDCGQEICDASPPHTQCSDIDPGIVCECPFC